MRAKLSLALIVRDEAHHLPECLACFRSLEPEICVVDTGSNDDTPDIARGLGAIVQNHPWENDFAAARNVALRMCTGEWIFVVDADERIDRADLHGFRRLLDGPRSSAYRFVTRNYTANPNVGGFQPCPDDDANGCGYSGWFPSAKVRLFPNDPRIEFENVVHELVNPSLDRAGYTVTTCDIPVHHYPLRRSQEAIARKQAHYIQLGLDKIRRCPTDPAAHIELGNQYADNGDYAAAAAAYRAALGLQPDNAEILKDLGGVLHLLGHNREAQTALELAVRLQPNLRDGWRNLGVVHSAQDEWRRAVRCLRQAVQIDPDWADGQRFLSIALKNAGQHEEALSHAQMALERMPNSAEAAALYADLMAAAGRLDQALHTFTKLLETRPSAHGWRHGYDRVAAEAAARNGRATEQDV